MSAPAIVAPNGWGQSLSERDLHALVVIGNGQSRSGLGPLSPGVEEAARAGEAIDPADRIGRFKVMGAVLEVYGKPSDDIMKAMLARPADTPPPAPRCVVHKAAEALGEIPPIEWVVKGVLTKGSVTLVVGEGGSKKTFLIIDCAVCVGMGKKWTQFETIQGPVLVIDEESGNNRMRRRLSAAMRGHGASGDLPLFYTSLANFNLRNETDIATVRTLVDEIRPVLVIIDALADVMPGADENTVKDVQPVFQALRSIAETYQCAVVVIHHANKTGSYRGSSVMKGAVDLMLMVDSKPETSNIDVTTEKARDIEPLTFSASAEFDNETDTVVMRESTPPLRVVRYSKSQEYVIRWLTDHPSASMKDIESHADDCTANEARKAVFGLVHLNVVCRSDGGGRGVKATYDLVARQSP